ncbi:hypothetical protein V1L52_09120 [Treponema sp. HNW]|uniref:hypothetical protein n=1 Tax=Treponema sp. HNW TaxID=3116654 RepID=UPI003D0A856D
MKRALLVSSLCALIFYAAACSSEKKGEMPITYSRILNAHRKGGVPTHRWFYFTDDGFKETDVPRNAPPIQKKPWTEAVRITSSVLIDDTGYFLVNKLGLLVCPPASGMQRDGIASKTVLVKDSDIFSDFACGSLFCIDDIPVFNLYTNSIFSSGQENLAEKSSKKSDAFLIRYDTEQHCFNPLLYRGDFDWPLQADIRELFFIDNLWYVLLKTDENRRTDFYAYSFKTNESLISFGQRNPDPDREKDGLSSKIVSEKIEVNDYREKIRPRDALLMPSRLKNVLVPVPPGIPWYLEYRVEGGRSPVRFVRHEHAPDPRQAFASAADSYSAVFFEDGTVCFAGTLPMKHVINEGKPVAFKLPRLSAGYTYSCALIAGSTLFAAWEETAFFETGRSGFVAVNLEEVLYGSEE